MCILLQGAAGQAVEGEYKFVAPDGEEYSVKYVADHLGFRILDTDTQAEFLEVDE